ncbi:disks large-associated protein 1 isoform X1 [Brienomyrus brachyistius]|uniref:disks large-associated protein 1 isoform X1 n=1 Tax=Brienomyrus brachyistius TaxID=42636 RepID=UPI0020B2D63F|nr:disks large-associated protein 1 isoform X1 [Brienomyrus brachyistius]XP_048867174.1 disks large-associated protein 1 isoform X1 [Brienomyrus brachyistius]XP_048867175.1 disks large-associated protein 1 isoform X1 [Brienomyrus brachyistius]XP_048867176.1 disks large-associated protein 1 isoform X1 [Brienomyrus brachyistius]
MKGLSSSRSHPHGIACEAAYDSMSRRTGRPAYLLSSEETHPADHPYYTQRNSFHTDYAPPYSEMVCSTFPRRHYSSHHEMKAECQAVVPFPGGSGKGGRAVSHNLLDQFERRLPATRDGFHTLQYKRTAAVEQRSDSPGRIRHLVHSVQRLFTKSQSLEGPGKGGVNSAKAGSDEAPAPRQGKRSKSRDRCKTTTDPQTRTAISGYWSSDDNLDRDVRLYRSPSGAMTMGRRPEKSQSHYYLETYNTMGDRTLKTSRSNNDVKCSACASMPVNLDTPLVKKSSWSSMLTVSRAREVYQKASVNVDKALVKSETCKQERSCQFLQVPQDDWGGVSSLGKDEEIPCRRMRSGSYIKAMADEDSGDSDGSPKPSPKAQARRASYLRATQPSLTEMTTLKISTEHSPKLQIRSHSYLRAVSEVSINRSLDSLDPTSLLASPKFRSRNESYMRAMSTISQVSEVEVNGQFESVCESVFSELESQAVDALDLPLPSQFRMRSHSYVRAIDQGCTPEGEGALTPCRAVSPPRSATTVRTIQSSTVSSCITTYKKTPPPVPPRTAATATKPFISITTQSSTESAQDAYGERSGGRTDSQSRLSDSTESIDSMKALTAAIEAANAQVHGPPSQHVSSSTVTITATASTVTQLSEDGKKDALRRSQCLSIGIQVDSPDDTLGAGEHCRFQSVGIQVEERCSYRRLTRSDSVTTAVQADLDHLEALSGLVDTPVAGPPSSGPIPRQRSRDAGTSTVSIQGSGNHYHPCADDDYPAAGGHDDSDVGFDPSILPPPDPWIDAVEDDPGEATQAYICQRDGHWFLKLLRAETERMEGWCRQMQQEEMDNDLPDEILGKIRSAVGSAQLLMSQKFQQFRELCEENLNPNANPRPISQDLAGFWDMLQLSIENISLKFDELHQLKANKWKPLAVPERKARRVAPVVPRKPPKGPLPMARDRSLESTERQRQEARKRLMAAKRAASARQSSATESADSIEIYIPEAQTRL